MEGASARPASALTLTTKRLQLSKPAQREQPGVADRSCSIDAEYPVVRGAGADLTRRLDAALEPQAKLEPECDFATSQEIRYTVALNDGEYLSVIYDSNWCCGAHPSYTKRFVNLRVADATLVTLDDAFRANAAQALAQRLTQLAQKTLPSDLELTAESLATYAENPQNFSLEAGGVRFSLFNETPHAIQSAFEEGFLLRCEELRPLLKESGSLAGFCQRR